MNHKRSVRHLAALLLLAQIGAALHADTSSTSSTEPVSTTPPPTAKDTPAASSDQVTELAKYTVSDVPVDNQVLPTVRPIGSVMGDERNIIDTPRSVSSVNKAWMEDRGIKDAMDFGQFAPGVYSAAQYGVPATPQIRGDLGELYVNGQRELYSRNSVLPSFNGVEALDIVKGPGSAVYGPQGQGPGGYVNLVTKQPYFDKQHTEITTTQGYWTTGRSYYNPTFTIDNSGPLSNKLAYRVSILDREGDGYYLGTKNISHDVFAALTWKPTDTITVDYWAQYYQNRFDEISGVNRVTQAQIDDQQYIGGPVQANNAFGGPVTSGPYFTLLNPATAHVTEIAPYVAMVLPKDYDKSKRFQTQAKTTVDLGSSGKLVNMTYYEDRTSNKYETSDGYTELVPLNYNIQNRTEWHIPEFDIGSTKNTAITGVEAKYERLRSYQDFSTEPFFIPDLSSPYPFSVIPLGNGTAGGGPAIPGHPGFGGNSFTIAGDQDSTLLDLAAFYQHDIKLSDQISGIFGVRYDRQSAKAFNPGYNTAPEGSQYNASEAVNNISTFNSLIYKITPVSSVYATYDRVNAVTGSANFGGVDATAGKEGLKNSLSALSELYEAGYKQAFFNNTLYFSFAAFHQSKMAPVLVGPPVKIVDRGLEFDSVYQPNKNLTINANMTFQQAVAYGGFFYEQTDNYLDGYPVGYIVDGKSGTGVGSPSYGGLAPASGHIKAPGVPPFLANFFIEYKFDNGFGAGAGPQFNGRQNANDEGTLHIPFQYEIDGYVFYKRKTWDVQLSVKNLLNQPLYDPIDVSFAGNDVVFRRQGIGASLIFRYRL